MTSPAGPGPGGDAGTGPGRTYNESTGFLWFLLAFVVIGGIVMEVLT